MCGMSDALIVGSRWRETIDDDWNTVLDQNQPIVRCKDCKHFKYFACEKNACTYCGELLRVEPDGFCAWGERREP